MRSGSHVGAETGLAQTVQDRARAPAPVAPVARVLQTGCGLLGTQTAEGLARSGYELGLVDFDRGEERNVLRQRAEPGLPKAETLAAACQAIRSGCARAFVEDIRHLGLRVLLDADLLLDVSDDPALRLALTRLSNGLGIPLVRGALDGSGTRALGRVRVSHGGAGRSCLVCRATPRELGSGARRLPCLGGRSDTRPPTRAGIPSAMATGGLVLHVIGLVLGGGEDAVDREIYLDLAGACLVGSIERADRCLSGHDTWQLEPLDLSVRDTTLGELFAFLSRELGAAPRLAPFEHPIFTAARCPACGEWKLAPGTRWAPVARCACGATLERRPEHALGTLDEHSARALDLCERTLGELGLPAQGALITARGSTGPARHFLLS